MIPSDMGPIVVLSASFNEISVELTYFEKKDQGDRAGMIKTIIVQNDVLGTDLEDLADTLGSCVDKALLEIRNPPESLDPRKRLSKKRELEEGTED